MVVKIPVELHGEILAKSVLGETSQEIADWLNNEKGCNNIKRRGVSKFIEVHKSERGEITSQVYDEEVKHTCMLDLEIVGEMIESLQSEYNKKVNKDSKSACEIANTLIKYLDFRKGLMGHKAGDNITQIDKAVIVQQLVSKIGV